MHCTLGLAHTSPFAQGVPEQWRTSPDHPGLSKAQLALSLGIENDEGGLRPPSCMIRKLNLAGVERQRGHVFKVQVAGQIMAQRFGQFVGSAGVGFGLFKLGREIEVQACKA